MAKIKRVSANVTSHPPKKKGEMSIVNLSSYTTPVVKEVKNQDWVDYGEKNNYFQYLIDRYNGSATNNAIINGISEMIYGKGLSATDSHRKPDQYAQAITLFNKKVVRKLVNDLKLMGNAALQVIYSKDRKKIVKVEHIPVETLRAETIDEETGDIMAYYYYSDWSKYTKRNKDDVQRIPSFGTSKEPLEILWIKPYRSGFSYYAPVDYQGGLQYAEIEEEIANYHLNNIKNGLAPSMLINFNNGVPEPEERRIIEKQISDKYTGSTNSGKFVLMFNDDPAAATTIEPIQLSDAADQYQFLSTEALTKIMVSHRVVSPMLLGIKDNSGLGNNADELRSASILMDNMVIAPFQRLIIDAFDDILAFNNIALDLYFKTLQPLEFTDMTGVTDQATIEQETGVKMSDDRPFLTDDHGDELLAMLEGLGEKEDLTDFELMDVEDAEDEPDGFDVESYLNDLSKDTQLSYGQESEFDTDLWKVRYRYVKGTRKNPSGESRKFCSTMLSADLLYRKEDIDAMSKKGVNSELGHNKQAYNLFRFKGGVNCYHRWERRVYKKKLKKDGTPYAGGALNGTKFVNVNEAIRQGFKINKQHKDVAIAPIDRNDKGHHPNYKG